MTDEDEQTRKNREVLAKVVGRWMESPVFVTVVCKRCGHRIDRQIRIRDLDQHNETFVCPTHGVLSVPADLNDVAPWTAARRRQSSSSRQKATTTRAPKHSKAAQQGRVVDGFTIHAHPVVEEHGQ
jgi:hypothetical protein